jgi:hypothetical protein
MCIFLYDIIVKLIKKNKKKTQKKTKSRNRSLHTSSSYVFCTDYAISKLRVHAGLLYPEKKNELLLISGLTFIQIQAMLINLSLANVH